MQMSTNGPELEWHYLRREMLLREAIQNLALLILAVLFGMMTMLAAFDGGGVPALPFVAAAWILASVWAHNDNLELRMSARLVELEKEIGVEWEGWLKTESSRLRGPVGSGHQVTTRGVFIGSAALAMLVSWHDGFQWLDVATSIATAGAMIVVLVPPRVIRPD